MHRVRALRLVAVLLSSGPLLLHAVVAWSAPVEPPALAGIPVDFILFAMTLVGIALFHHYTLPIAVGGLIVVSLEDWLLALHRRWRRRRLARASRQIGRAHV